MDIKRVAFETRPVKSARPAVGVQQASQPVAAKEQIVAGGKIDRQEIAAIVDRFLANRPSEPAASPLPTPAPAQNAQPAPRPVQASAPTGATNGRKAADFVSEDDVKRAIQKGEKIYVGPKTIITPSARDIGEPAEIFAKA